MVGNAHIDPVWLWRWQEGFAEVKATFRSALDRMEGYPEFVFTCACSQYYRWIEDNEPAMFAEIRRRVNEGRWVLVGGWIIQPDCNLPSGESFARQSLLGQRYFREHLGKVSTVGYNVDSFGHNAALPQILTQSGMPRYVMMRPQEHEMTLPGNLFLWQGIDGTSVPAFRIPINYASWFEAEPLSGKLDKIIPVALAQNTPFMAFYGVGNHGGGPTIAHLETILEFRAQHGEEALVFSSPPQFFDEVAAQGLELPVVASELQHHASGCYAAHAYTKASNRLAEARLTTAERFAVLAGQLTGAAYPQVALNDAWTRALFNQFHDVAGGCCVPEAYDDQREMQGVALTLAAEALNAAVQRLSWQVDTMVEGGLPLNRHKDWHYWEKANLGTPVVVFNPHTWPVESFVRVNRKIVGATDDQGRGLPLQKVRAARTIKNDETDVLFPVSLPPLGWKLHWVFLDEPKPFEAPKFPVQVGVNRHVVMGNGLLRVEIDQATGGLASLTDLRTGREVWGPGEVGALPLVIDESHCDTWSHDVLVFDKAVGLSAGSGRVTWAVLDQGPLVGRIRTETRFGNSSLRQDFVLHAGSDRLEVSARVDWHETHKLLKLVFPVAVTAPKATWEVPFGALERPVNGEEEPGQLWVDLSGTAADGKPLGLALLSPDLCSHSVHPAGGEPHGAPELRLTVVRSPIFADHWGTRDGQSEYMDQGRTGFRYALLPHAGDWRAADLSRRALEFAIPPTQVIETYHPGTLPRAYSGLSVTPASVVIDAVKRAEDGTGTIVRCHESTGRPTKAHFAGELLGRSWEADLKPYEIRTVLLPDDRSKPLVVVNLLEDAL